MYQALPLNGRGIYDLLIRGTRVVLPGGREPILVDLAVNFDDTLGRVGGKIVEDAYPIPRRAVYGENIVYKVKNGLFENAAISIAKNEPTSIIANGGLSDGDTLVVDVLQGISPGMAAQARIVSSEEYTRK